MIKARNLDPALRALVFGNMIGDVYFVDGSSGSDMATGVDADHALKKLATGAGKLRSGYNDYVLCYGAETATGAVALTQASGHIIGIGNGGLRQIE
jgi:hypothetical protein